MSLEREDVTRGDYRERRRKCSREHPFKVLIERTKPSAVEASSPGKEGKARKQKDQLRV
jgi:hypothetical protein